MGNLFDRPFHTTQDMSNNKEVIKPIFKEFEKQINRKLRKHNGIIDNKTVEECIDKAKKKKILSQQESLIVETFFDTYIGQWHSFGREFASDFAKEILYPKK